jgi:hypothetical protein
MSYRSILGSALLRSARLKPTLLGIREAILAFYNRRNRFIEFR